ncbi:unnamed protein product [Echinostoma caproni]|uniref:DDE_3 domain-containing protein n=1 Tax=Echinostoma caproni TaxID=27848 RepID=A0A183A2A2_9TREM|nr:unnamed protein product [Echinostoma caproni]
MRTSMPHGLRETYRYYYYYYRLICIQREPWEQWKTLFNNYIDLLPVLNPVIALDESHKLRVLRRLPGDEGQRKIDGPNLQACLNVQSGHSILDRFVGSQLNVFTARF